jgi:SpoVK/Ycf46/Vps4 family AAA+-type ATPase
MKSTHTLTKENWWKLEENFRGEVHVKPGERILKLILPEFEVKTNDKPHPALLTVEHSTIKAVDLIVSEKLNTELEVISGLCESSTFERYCNSLGSQSNKGLIVQLHGEPGTGKTEFCYQLARKTNRNILMLDISQVRDKYYGETEKLVTGIFNSYRKAVSNEGLFPILLFNEGDSIFQRRIDNEHGSTQTENTIQTILLNELERFQGIMLITTNTPNHFDKAFERRFQYRLKFDLPDFEVRCKLLKQSFPEVESAFIEQVAHAGIFSAADLLNVKRKMQIQELLGKGRPESKDVLQMLLDEKSTHRKAIGF